MSGVEIPIPSLAMYAAMKVSGLDRVEMNQFTTYLERLDITDSPKGSFLEMDAWFAYHIKRFRASGNPLIKK